MEPRTNNNDGTFRLTGLTEWKFARICLNVPPQYTTGFVYIRIDQYTYCVISSRTYSTAFSANYQSDFERKTTLCMCMAQCTMRAIGCHESPYLVHGSVRTTFPYILTYNTSGIQKKFEKISFRPYVLTKVTWI